jgi:N-acetylneuraminate synthase
MDVDDLKRLAEIIEQIHISLGSDSNKKPIKTEAISRLNARRSIVLNRDVTANHRLQEQDLTYKRPGTGISPLLWDKVVGSRTIRNLRADHILQWNDIHS